MKALTEHIKSVDQRSLKIGLGAVIGFYVLFYIYILTFSGSVLKEIEKGLATQIVPVSKMKSAATHSDTHSNDAVKELPLLIEGMYEKSENGNIPVIRQNDKLTSFNAYKRPFALPAEKRPILSVIVADFGLSQESSKTALDILPPEVSYALSAESKQAEEWAKILRQSGREFWVTMPFSMQNNMGDTGPATLYATAPLAQNQRTFRRVFGSIPSTIGMASRLPQEGGDDFPAVRKITEELFARGLGYIELNPHAGNELANLALAQNAPYIKSDIELIFLPDQNPFTDLERILKSQGYAMAVIANYPKNIKRLAEWLIKIGQADYTLAPPSVIYDLPLLLAEQERKAGSLRGDDKVEPPTEMQHAPAP